MSHEIGRRTFLAGNALAFSAAAPPPASGSAASPPGSPVLDRVRLGA